MRKKIRLQMEKSEQTENFLANTELISKGSENVFIVSMLINLMIAGLFAFMTMWIQSM